MLLGEMGADVIKIEAPGKGDDSRQWGAQLKGESLYFLHYNKNKRSCALDLKTTGGREAFLRLVKRSDVVVENFRPGVMGKLGLSYRQLKQTNSRLIYCAVSGFGQTGPYSQLGGYDAIVQGMSGIMSVTGEPDGEPLRVGLPITDIVAALYAAFSVALALFWREKTGRGQFVDISLLEAGVGAMGQWVSVFAGTGEIPRRFGNKYPLISPYEPIETRDGHIMVAVGNEELWKSFCRIIGRSDLLEDPRFATNLERIRPENRRQLIETLTDTLRRDTAEAWIAKLWAGGVPAGPINSVDRLLQDPHLLERGLFVDVEHPRVGRLRTVGVVPKFELTQGSVKSAAPLLGQHTREVLKEVGYDDEEIDRMARESMIQA